MSDESVPELIGGPYKRPEHAKLGERVRDTRLGFVQVHSFSQAPIPWPMQCKGGGTPCPILIGDLIEAVKTESAAAICHHFGVSRDTVKRWRKELNVQRMNAGTKQLWSDKTEERLGEHRAKGGRMSALKQNLVHRLLERLKCYEHMWFDEDRKVASDAEEYLESK